VLDRVKPSFVIFDIRALWSTLRAVLIWQQWASKGQASVDRLTTLPIGYAYYNNKLTCRILRPIRSGVVFISGVYVRFYWSSSGCGTYTWLRDGWLIVIRRWSLVAAVVCCIHCNPQPLIVCCRHLRVHTVIPVIRIHRSTESSIPTPPNRSIGPWYHIALYCAVFSWQNML